MSGKICKCGVTTLPTEDYRKLVEDLCDWRSEAYKAQRECSRANSRIAALESEAEALKKERAVLIEERDKAVENYTKEQDASTSWYVKYSKLEREMKALKDGMNAPSHDDEDNNNNNKDKE